MNTFNQQAINEQIDSATEVAQPFMNAVIRVTKVRGVKALSYGFRFDVSNTAKIGDREVAPLVDVEWWEVVAIVPATVTEIATPADDVNAEANAHIEIIRERVAAGEVILASTLIKGYQFDEAKHVDTLVAIDGSIHIKRNNGRTETLRGCRWTWHK